MEEVFIGLKGFEDKYQIGNFGTLKSLSRIIGNSSGYLMSENIKKVNYDKDGYPVVNLSIGGRRTKIFRIHKLVAMYFLNNGNDLPKGRMVCHKDNNVLNNKVDNLYIGDVISNTIDRYNSGTTKYSIDTMKEIMNLWKSGLYTQKELTAMYNCNSSWISRFVNGKRNTPLNLLQQSEMDL